jgi:hypothetical protein
MAGYYLIMIRGKTNTTYNLIATTNNSTSNYTTIEVVPNTPMELSIS